MSELFLDFYSRPCVHAKSHVNAGGEGDQTCNSWPTARGTPNKKIIIWLNVAMVKTIFQSYLSHFQPRDDRNGGKGWIDIKKKNEMSHSC